MTHDAAHAIVGGADPRTYMVRTVSGGQFIGELRLHTDYLSVVSPSHHSFRLHSRIALEHVESISYALEA
jgi:hypothetical protein